MLTNSMTRRHFKSFARHLHQVKPREEQYDNALEFDIAHSVWYDCVHAAIRSCKEFNGNFDSGKFILACTTGRGAE